MHHLEQKNITAQVYNCCSLNEHLLLQLLLL